jgi:hypothetical protein
MHCVKCHKQLELQLILSFSARCIIFPPHFHVTSKLIFVLTPFYYSTSHFSVLFLWFQLKRLSFSYCAAYTSSLCQEIESIAPELQRLEFLLVYVRTVCFDQWNMFVLYKWLSHCIGLKELWVRNGNIYVEFDVACPYEHFVEPYYTEICVRQPHHRCGYNWVPKFSHLINV